MTNDSVSVLSSVYYQRNYVIEALREVLLYVVSVCVCVFLAPDHETSRCSVHMSLPCLLATIVRLDPEVFLVISTVIYGFCLGRCAGRQLCLSFVFRCTV